jgi:two-component system sensor histidine kinase PhoQ
MEMCGNLLENAFKWCEQEVVFRVRKREGKHEGESVLEIQVEDDGPGIPQDARNRVFMRGVRADQSRPGHGIGLAVVNDLVSAYHGKLAIEEGARKGARVCIVIPL